MKLSATVSALVLSALASTSGTEALSGGRRSVSLNNNNAVVAGGSAANLVKRVSLDQMKEATNMKKVKRQPLPNAAPIAAAAGFGAIPSMNDGTMPVVGLSKRQDSFGAHNGKQGTHVVSQNSVKSSNNGSSSSGSSSSTSSSSSSDSSDDADAEECDDEEDGEDDAEDCEEDDGDDDEECEEDDSAADDAEDCDEEDDSADDEEDCDEEEDDSTSSSTSSSTDDNTVAATANVNVNLKQSNNNSNDNKDNGSSSSSSKQNNQNGEQTRAWSSSASATKTSSSSKSEATESSSSADGQSYTGIATWYTQNGNAGACGTVNPDSARIIALYTSAYANGDNCGRSVVIKNLDDGTQTTATVADMCPSCGGPQDIDLSVGAFQAIDPEYQTHGVRNIEWYFTD